MQVSALPFAVDSTKFASHLHVARLAELSMAPSMDEHGVHTLAPAAE